MRMTVVGAGYVGLVSGTCLSEVGHEVTIVDSDLEKVKKLNEGIIPIFEPGLEAMISRNIDHNRLSFTSNLKDAMKQSEAVFIAVGTPQGEDGSADLKYVLSVAENIGQYMTQDLLVIVKSTVPIGTCDRVETLIQEQLSSRNLSYKVTVASNPEFLKEGVAIQDFIRPDRIIVGIPNKETEALFYEIYEPFITDDPGKLLFMDRRSSELTKYGANAMLATRISFMNELARLCEVTHADIDSVRRGIGSDARIGRKFLYAGPGYGGSCFPKDVEALLRTAKEHDIDLSLIEATKRTNLKQKELVAEIVLNHFGELKGKKIALWGLTFKPGTDDVRDTPALTMIEYLIQHGAHIIAHDPKGKSNFQKLIGEKQGLSYASDSYDALENADALVLITEWPEYKRPNWEKIYKLMRTKNVFDFRNQYDAKKIKQFGFYYRAIGKNPDQIPNT